MEVYGTVKEVQLKADLPKRGGGTYPGWFLKYIDKEGNEQVLKNGDLSLKKIKGLKEGLLSLSENDSFSATLEKNGQYWEVLEVRKGGVPSLGAAASHNSGTITDDRQKMIVRQNCLGHATQLASYYFGADNTTDAAVNEVIRLAEILEKWVMR